MVFIFNSNQFRDDFARDSGKFVWIIAATSSSLDDNVLKNLFWVLS